MAYEKRAPQTQCKRGHEMVGNNVIVRADGYRRCRACVRLVKRRWDKKNRAAKRMERILRVE